MIEIILFVLALAYLLVGWRTGLKQIPMFRARGERILARRTIPHFDIDSGKFTGVPAFPPGPKRDPLVRSHVNQSLLFWVVAWPFQGVVFWGQRQIEKHWYTREEHLARLERDIYGEQK